MRRRVRAEESRDAVAPRVGSVGSGSVSSDDYSASTGNPSEAGQGDSGNFATGRNVDVPGVRLDDEDLRLLAACLPQQLQGLDLQGAVRVVALLRERIEAGWSTEAIRLAMDQPLPDKVRRLSSLVAHRLDVNVAPELAPSRVRAAASETRLWADVVSDRQRISEEIAAEVVSEVDPVWAQAWEDVATAYPNVSRVEQMKLTLARVEALGRSVAG
ncbi:MAG: hypothetical protein Q4D87_05775 [Actinomycetaceae bacterium]|nr:hypothetical protein [Actinomycetaceae bacterium]